MRHLFVAAALSGFAFCALTCGADRRAQPQAAESPGVKQAPGFDLVGSDGKRVSLAKLLERGPVVAVFYRGDW